VVRFGRPTEQHPEGYRAPSWSWAAPEGSVEFGPVRTPLAADSFVLLDHDIQLEYSGDPFRAVRTATVKIKGLSEDGKSLFLDTERREQHKASGPDDCQSDIALFDDTRRRSQIGAVQHIICLGLCHNVVGIPWVRTWQQAGDRTDHDLGLCAMMLEPTGADRDQYRCLGLVLLDTECKDFFADAVEATITLI